MTKTIDLTEDSPALGKAVVQPPVNPDLRSISAEGIRLLMAKQRVTRAEDELALAKEELRSIQDITLPEAMAVVGLEKFTLVGGGEIEVKQIIEGSIPKDRELEAFEWLRRHEFSDLIKRTVSVPFGRGEDKRAGALIKLIQRSRMDFEDRSTVHHSTLKAWAREMLAHGKPFPQDLLGLYVARRAVVKP